MFHPVNPGWLTRPGWSEFGSWRVHGTHQGFDYYVPRGTLLYASGDGLVTNAAYAEGWGWFVDVTYDRYKVRVAHMNGRPSVSRGQAVNATTVIGVVGQSGNAANIEWNGLIHPHVEVKPITSDDTINPLSVLRDYPRPGFAGGEVIPIEPEENEPAPPTIEEKEIAMSRPWMIQERDPSSSNYGIVVLMMDNGLYRTLTGAERDAYQAVVGPAFPCTVPGRFGLFLRDAEREREFLRVTSNGDLAPAIISNSEMIQAAEIRLSAQIADLPEKTIQELRDSLS